MTALKESLLRRIEQSGPLNVAEYMAECLLHPKHGYYTTQSSVGAKGDFITAPEISQMFGEVIGLWLAQVWLDQGAPKPFYLAELGPGRGTLMADILRATAAVQGFHDAMQLHLIEASPILQKAQSKALQGHDITHHLSVADLPEGPLFLVANEFFDALPIRQFQRSGNAWRERLIGAKDGALHWGLGPEGAIPPLQHRLADTEEGQIIELNPASEAIAEDIGRRIADHGGAGLIIDYGDALSRENTFQAVKTHAYTDPLEEPGLVDLTAHVAFGPLAQAAQPARASKLTAQGVFLERLGITQRAQTLAAALSGEALNTHIAAHRRLTHPEEMGNLFKVLALTPASTPLPPALDV